MKKLLQKRSLVMVALVVALGVAVYLNYYFTKEPLLSTGGPEVEGSSETDEPASLGEAVFVDQPTGDGTEKKGEDPAVAASAKVSCFDQARANRTAAREEALGLLRDLLNDPQATAAERADAMEKAEGIAQNILTESNIEGLILAKNFPDAVAYVENGHCAVTVAAKELDATQSIQIMEIAVAQTGIAPQQIQILPVAP